MQGSGFRVCAVYHRGRRVVSGAQGAGSRACAAGHSVQGHFWAATPTCCCSTPGTGSCEEHNFFIVHVHECFPPPARSVPYCRGRRSSPFSEHINVHDTPDCVWSSGQCSGPRVWQRDRKTAGGAPSAEAAVRNGKRATDHPKKQLASIQSNDFAHPPPSSSTFPSRIE